MTEIDIAEFERRLDALLAAHEQLRANYRTLESAHRDEQKRNRETRERLNGVIERLRALETQAENNDDSGS